MSKLSLNPNIVLSPIETGYVAFNIATEKLFELNPLASLLMELCDGSRTIDDLTTLVQPLMPDDANGAILRWLDEARASDLLIGDLEPSPERPAIDQTGVELAGIVNRLRAEGKVQAAFHCQQRVVELAPDIAQYWCHLGELAHIVGKREVARRAYEQYLVLNPGDAEVAHLLVSLRDETAPPRVPDNCIQHLYRRFSTYYESNMVEELGYEGPQHLFDAVRATLGNRSQMSILDLVAGLVWSAHCSTPRHLAWLGSTFPQKCSPRRGSERSIMS